MANDIKAPWELPRPLPFHTPQNRSEHCEKGLGHFLSQEQAESKQVPGGFTSGGLGLKEWGGFSLPSSVLR